MSTYFQHSYNIQNISWTHAAVDPFTINEELLCVGQIDNVW